MLKSLHIKNFRGFRDLKIESLKRVNLLTGQNNTGKTGVLEALAFFLNEPDPGQCHKLPDLFRSVGSDNSEILWEWLFFSKSSASNLQIHGTFDNQKDFTVLLHPRQQATIDFPVSSLIPCGEFAGKDCFTVGGLRRADLKPAIFSTKPSDPIQDAIDYNRVVLKKRNKQVEDMLRQIEPRLETLQPLQFGQSGQTSTPLIYAGISGLSEMIPVTQLGQGFNRLLDIYSELVVADARVLLIDEIENGLHYSVLPLVWKGLFLAAQEFDVQIFATTHSWECIQAADQTAREREPYELELIRLDRVKEDIKATIIDKDALATAKELGWEMR
jgi:AAA15 family ATPase/GTPase